MSLFEVTGLCKSYFFKSVLENINFSLADNEITALVGVNGSGKTTLFKAIIGLLDFQKGRVVFADHDLEQHPYFFRKHLRFLSEVNPLYEDLSVKEYFVFLNALWRGGERLNDFLPPLLEKLRLADRQNSLIRNLSKGLKQRVGLIGSLIGSPKLIVLDEPFSGLDPRQIFEMRDFFLSLKKTTAIFFSSHLISEVSQLADKVIFLNQGKIIGEDRRLKDDFPQGVKSHFPSKNFYALQMTKPLPTKNSVEDFLKKNGLKHLKKLNFLFIEQTPNLNLNQLFDLLNGSQIKIKEIKLLETDLESKFLNYLT